MRYQLQNLSLLQIKHTNYNTTSYGGNQAWYPSFWHKKAGCGPTTAANQMAYLAMTREIYRPLYAYESVTQQASFTKHMQSLYDYVTPTMMGVNHIQLLAEGGLSYAKNRGISLDVYTHSVDKKDFGKRDNIALMDFIKKGLSEDSPIAFLNLSSGKEHRLYPWHWITITEAEILNDRVIATASDEGHKKTFDLTLWYQTTPIHGGFVYFL